MTQNDIMHNDWMRNQEQHWILIFNNIVLCSFASLQVTLRRCVLLIYQIFEPVGMFSE